MKKFLVLIAIVIVALTTLTAGCSNVNQLKMLSLGWQDYEEFTYNVYDISNGGKVDIGDMSYTFRRINGDEEVNGKAITGLNGGCVETKLTIDAGTYAGTQMYSKVVFDSNLLPQASYKSFDSSDNSLDYTVFADYTFSNKKGTYVLNDAQPVEFTKTQSRSSCYDNESLYSIIRASVFDTKSYSLSVYTPGNSDYSLKAVSVVLANNNISVTSDIPEEEATHSFACTMLKATVPAEFGNGTILYSYFSNESYKADGKSVVKLPVRIDEGNYQYVLKQVSTVQPE